MSIFRLLIASLLFCQVSFAQAGYLYRGTCFADPESAITKYVSEITGLILSDGSSVKYRYHYDTVPGQYYVEWTKFAQNSAPIETYSHIHLLNCEDTAAADAISLAWKIILVWLAAWAIAQLIRIVRTESDGASDYGHS